MQKKRLVGNVPFYLKFWVRQSWRKIADFQSIIAHSASAVRPSEKSSMITNRQSTTNALSNEPKMNIVRCLYTPKGWLKNAKCPKFEQ